MKERSTEVVRLVVRAPNWLGDAVMALPALGAVRAAFPGAHLAIAATPSIAPLFEEATNAAQDNVLRLGDARIEPRTLAAGQFDTALLLTNSFRSAWAARGARIPRRWGYAAQLRTPLLTTAVTRPRGALHQSQYYLELVRRLGLPAGDDLPRVTVTTATAARAESLLAARGVTAGSTCVGFAPGAAYGHAKRWPPRRVADVVARLSRDRHVTCVLFGVEGDRDAGREIESSLPHGVGVVNLIGRTDLRLLAGVIARCAAFVSNDSGAMHLAAALGVPVTAIFGPTDERATAPAGWPGAAGENDVLTHPVFCRPCMLRECPIDHRCMKGITAEAVADSVSRRLMVTR